MSLPITNLLWKTLIFSVFAIFCTSCKSTRKVSKFNPKYETAIDLSYYESKLGFKPDLANHQKFLYDFIIDWLGTPYKFGGCTKAGTDCSCFVFNVYKEVFNKTLPRSTHDIAKAATPIKSHQLRTGDLIFFNTDGKKISHIGIHLQGDKFVHASTKNGVMISSMNEEYFKKTFRGYGTFF